MLISCLECSTIFSSKEKRQKFCNHSCSALYNNRLRGLKAFSICLCGNKFQTRNKAKFCSYKCRKQKYIEDWKNELIDALVGDTLSATIKVYIKEKYDNKCHQCGWCEVNLTTNKIPLHIDHIDGNYKNNKEENLRLLCPNCHSLTATFGSLNRGKGRKERYLRRKKYLKELKEEARSERNAALV